MKEEGSRKERLDGLGAGEKSLWASMEKIESEKEMKSGGAKRERRKGDEDEKAVPRT